MISVASACVPRYIQGTVSDSVGNPVSNSNVQIECTNKYGQTVSLSNITDSSGHYSIGTTNDVCKDGKNVYASVVIADNSASETKKMTGLGITINLNFEDYQVPEFSTITALAALIGSGAGFLVLRKKNKSN